MTKLLRRDDRGDLLGLLEGRGREMMRQVKFANCDFDVDSEVVLAPEDFDHAAARILSGRGPVGDFNVDHNPFKVVPVRFTGSLVTQHSVHRLRFGSRSLAAFLASM